MRSCYCLNQTKQVISCDVYRMQCNKIQNTWLLAKSNLKECVLY